MQKTKLEFVSSINKPSIFLQEMKLRSISEEIMELQKKENPKFVEYQHIADKIDRVILILSNISRAINGSYSPKLANAKSTAWKKLEKLERNCNKSLNLSIW